MPNRISISAIVVVLFTTPAWAGEILLSHTKALAGDVTPGDAPGFPITLTLPGSYKFDSNIHPSPNTIGIIPFSQDISIDLNGFRLHGSGTAYYGITGSVKNVTIKNGTIAGFKFDGVYGTGKYWTVENMQVMENGRYGVRLDAQAGSGRVVNSMVSDNAYIGITCVACLIQGNVVASNGSIGMSTAAASILGNLIYDNGGVGASLNGGGYGQNTVIYNDNNSANQVNGGDPLDPNYCYVAC